MNSSNLILILLFALYGSSQSSNKLKLAKKLVEKKGLKACQEQFKRSFCLKSVVPISDLVSQTDDEKVRIKNKSSLAYLTYDNRGKIFFTDEESAKNIWRISNSTGSYKKIKTLSGRLLLLANSNSTIVLSQENNVQAEEWFINKITEIIMNRKFSRPLALTVQLNEAILGKNTDRSDPKLREWEIIKIK